MKKIYPSKLLPGDEIRVIAPSRSLAIVFEKYRKMADQKLAEMGLKLSFGEHVMEKDEFASSSIDSRVADLYAAFADPRIKAVITVIGGFNCNQLLRYLDWELIKHNPKIFCGFSDITALSNAVYAKTGLVSYSGPHYCNFGTDPLAYSSEYFKKCLFDKRPFEIQPSKAWAEFPGRPDAPEENPVQNEGFWLIHSGQAAGTILGANLCTFNLLQGTEYFPDLQNSLLFIEDDYMSDGRTFDRDLQSVIHLPSFSGVKGLVIGRFQKASKVNRELLARIINTKKELDNVPVIANVDFGHTNPRITFPIGGEASLIAETGQVKLVINRH
jgi:muramoyltetrapeptide carboxypeptidase